MKKIKKISPSIIVYLQITEPLRKLWMIDKCIQTLKKNKKIDTAFMAKKFYKNIWEEKGNKTLESLKKNMEFQDN